MDNNNRIKRQISNDSLSDKINTLEEIRKDNTKFFASRDHKSNEELRKEIREEYKFDGKIHKITDLYHEAAEASEKAKEGKLYNILTKDELNKFYSQFTKIHQTLDEIYKECLEAGNILQRKKKMKAQLRIHEETLGKNYKNLATAIIEYYHSARDWKDKIEIKLYILTPDGSPELSSNSITDDIKNFIHKNIAEIVNNERIDDQYKFGILNEVGASSDKTVVPALVALLLTAVRQSLDR
jgi:hypothetical protein